MFPEYEIEEATDPLYAYKASANPDTMYLHEAMKEPDRAEFIKVMEKEVADQMNNGNFSIMPRSELPKGQQSFPPFGK